MPEWWNGRHGCLKSICLKRHAGSSPASGTHAALFHSDGCRLINRVRRPPNDGDRWYEYPQHLFVNRSAGCAVRRWTGWGVMAWRFSKPTATSVAPGEAVATLDEFVGPKH
jgi:hypothetical protein